MASHPALHELETKIMAEVWAQEEATVRSVTDALAVGEDVPRSYTTILHRHAPAGQQGLPRSPP